MVEATPLMARRVVNWPTKTPESASYAWTVVPTPTSATSSSPFRARPTPPWPVVLSGAGTVMALMTAPVAASNRIRRLVVASKPKMLASPSVVPVVGPSTWLMFRITPGGWTWLNPARLRSRGSTRLAPGLNDPATAVRRIALVVSAVEPKA